MLLKALYIGRWYLSANWSVIYEGGKGGGGGGRREREIRYPYYLTDSNSDFTYVECHLWLQCGDSL